MFPMKAWAGSCWNCSGCSTHGTECVRMLLSVQRYFQLALLLERKCGGVNVVANFANGAVSGMKEQILCDCQGNYNRHVVCVFCMYRLVINPHFNVLHRT